MAVSKETLKAIIRDYHGFQLSDEELDLSQTMSSRLLRVKEGGDADG